MGLFDAIFGRKRAEPQSVAFQTLTAYQPAFRTWGGQIYENELVRAAVDAHARHASKLKYTMEGQARQKLWTLTKSAPNPWMTWPQFLERCSNIYQTQNNLFIVPLLDDMGEVAGYFPVLPSECEVVDVGGQPWLKFTFIRGQKKSLPLRRIGVVVKHQLKDDFFGSPNTALNGTMELVNMVNQGIEEGVKNGATFRFMAQLNAKAFDEDLRKERERFDKNNFRSGGGGLLLFGNQFSNVQQLKADGYKVDADQMRLIQANVSQYFGVGQKIMTNEAMGDELDAFFNGATEIFSIKLSDAMTLMTYTTREINGGNRIQFTANRLQYMSVNSKIAMAQQLGDRGILTIDEIRELFNYVPLEDGTGNHLPIRGEYYFADEGKNPDGDEKKDPPVDEEDEKDEQGNTGV